MKKKKVPVIMQMEALECGAASLCMILAYYKKWVPLPEVRSIMDVSRDGVTAMSIIKTAKSYGMDAKGFRCRAENLAEKMTLPCILFWKNCHFVVLTGITKKGYCLNDPATGPRVVSAEQFTKDYSGIALSFVPTFCVAIGVKRNNKAYAKGEQAFGSYDVHIKRRSENSFFRR